MSATKTTLWLNVWAANNEIEPYEVSVHMSRHDAVDAIAADLEEEGGSYVCTVEVDVRSRDRPYKLNLEEEAREYLEEIRNEKESAETEARMMRWRQSGL